MKKVEGNIVDIHTRRIYPGEIYISAEGKIEEILPNSKSYKNFICPGFVDAHVHIESSMLTPSQFAKMVVRKGTVAVVNDPHEIANVMGIAGIEFMIENAREAAIKFFFAAPSCVPATSLDSAGSVIQSAEIENLFKTYKFVALSEMMNVPGVLYADQEVKRKLEAAQREGLPIDGHAPGLKGKSLKIYIEAGISTDHECTTLEEALEKLKLGMKILIRDGSAARNFEALHPLIGRYPEQLMFCVDDAHPDDILENGEIDKIIKKSLALGYDLFDVLKIASKNVIEHYRLPVGMLRKGEDADFVIVENLETFEVLSTYIQGKENYKKGENSKRIFEKPAHRSFLNCFDHLPVTEQELKKRTTGIIPVIEVEEGEIVTRKYEYIVKGIKENLESDVSQDILKIAYINRYQNGKPQIAFVKGIGLKQGAFATTVAHDSHNILAVSVRDKDMKEVVNAIIEAKGGLAVKNEKEVHMLPLPIGGIMSEENAEVVAEQYRNLNEELKRKGCKLSSPFMTLAFMSLLVIPALKIGESGLFDYEKFSFFDRDRREF